MDAAAYIFLKTNGLLFEYDKITWIYEFCGFEPKLSFLKSPKLKNPQHILSSRSVPVE